MSRNSLNRKIVIKLVAAIIGIGCFLFFVRMFIIFTSPISLSYGGREIDLPIENYRASANGGPSLKFFGGIRESMHLTVYEGRRTVWQFSAEMYPRSISWRGSAIFFHDKDNSVTFSQGVPDFIDIIVETHDIMCVSQISEYKGRSEISSKSQNSGYEAFAMSDTDKMELFVKGPNQEIIWQCKMSDCTSVINWKDCIVEWNDSGIVIFNYEPGEKSYIKRFIIYTPQLLDLEQNESFVY